jgi:hypothetical protein
VSATQRRCSAGGGFQSRTGAPLRGRRVLVAVPLDGRLTNGIGEGEQVIRSGTGRNVGHRKSDDVPTAGHRQPVGVHGAQVVAMGFRVGGKGAEDSC